MKKCVSGLLGIILVLCANLGASAKTITEGTLDIQNLATEISGDLREYGLAKNMLADNIRSAKAGIQKLKKDLEQTQSNKEKTRLRAATLKETSDLLDYYSQFYNLNVQTIKRILPRLETMREEARKGALEMRQRN